MRHSKFSHVLYKLLFIVDETRNDEVAYFKCAQCFHKWTETVKKHQDCRNNKLNNSNRQLKDIQVVMDTFMQITNGLQVTIPVHQIQHIYISDESSHKHETLDIIEKTNKQTNKTSSIVLTARTLQQHVKQVRNIKKNIPPPQALLHRQSKTS